MGIENIHSMRDSMKKLFELVRTEIRGESKSNWFSSLENTRWLEHIRSLLLSCSQCVKAMHEDQTSLLIHCSDGWDRTAQLTSLTKICLDPYYRTFTGFQVLIEQEWCAFGHQFQLRCGTFQGNMKTTGNYYEDEHVAPIFMQFIDALYQLLCQFPCSFEFNQRYLIALLDEVYEKRSGTFLFDTEKKRMELNTISRTCSVWSFLQELGHTFDFHNPFYHSKRNVDTCPEILQFSWHPSTLTFWSSYYLRSFHFNERIRSQEKYIKELQLAQEDLHSKLTSTHEELQAQVEINSLLHAKYLTLRKDYLGLQQSIQGQVFHDNSTGFILSEHEDTLDGIVVNLTQSNKNKKTKTKKHPKHIKDNDDNEDDDNDNDEDEDDNEQINSKSKKATASFISASISNPIDIIQTYFDPNKIQVDRI